MTHPAFGVPLFGSNAQRYQGSPIPQPKPLESMRIEDLMISNPTATELAQAQQSAMQNINNLLTPGAVMWLGTIGDVNIWNTLWATNEPRPKPDPFIEETQASLDNMRKTLTNLTV